MGHTINRREKRRIVRVKAIYLYFSVVSDGSETNYIHAKRHEISDGPRKQKGQFEIVVRF